MFTRGSLRRETMVCMLAMTGTLRLEFARAADELARWLHRYQTVRITETQRVVLIPPIGSFLIDWDPSTIRIHIAAPTRRELDELMSQLGDQLRLCPGAPVLVEWATSLGAPIPVR